MGKLIAVEYSPVSYRDDAPAPNSRLYGCVGETLEHVYKSALKSGGKLPVRFPFNTTNFRLNYLMNSRDPEDQYSLIAEGVSVNSSDLYPLKKKPFSYYTRRGLVNKEDLHKLTESDSYLSTYSLGRTLTIIEELSKRYGYLCVLGEEWHLATLVAKNIRPLFQEARFYGLDTVLSLYDKKAVSGVVIELITRPWPSKEAYDKGSKVSISRSNVYLVSDTKSYVCTVDGVDTHRKTTTSWGSVVTGLLVGLVPAEEVNANKYRSSLDKMKLSAESKKEIFKLAKD